MYEPIYVSAMCTFKWMAGIKPIVLIFPLQLVHPHLAHHPEARRHLAALLPPVAKLDLLCPPLLQDDHRHSGIAWHTTIICTTRPRCQDYI
jgi:hypothetical protein